MLRTELSVIELYLMFINKIYKWNCQQVCVTTKLTGT